MSLFYSRVNIHIILVSIFIFFLTACGSSTHKAPVVEAPYIKLPPKGYYRTRVGDTLYAIAWGYNLDYRSLAQANHLSYPYKVHPGQVLRVDLRKSPIKIHTKKQFIRIEPPSHAVSGWIWPTKGSLITTFDPAHGNKGINIAANSGSPIHASAAGEIVYCGSGLRAYGQMIIIKHNADYFSAYAHNKKLMVKEGQMVKRGQIIALMGNTGTDRTMLHFEIRKAGKPVNPLAFLPKY